LSRPSPGVIINHEPDHLGAGPRTYLAGTLIPSAAAGRALARAPLPALAQAPSRPSPGHPPGPRPGTLPALARAPSRLSPGPCPDPRPRSVGALARTVQTLFASRCGVVSTHSVSVRGGMNATGVTNAPSAHPAPGPSAIRDAYSRRQAGVAVMAVPMGVPLPAYRYSHGSSSAVEATT
jgi:hypothetical protein